MIKENHLIHISHNGESGYIEAMGALVSFQSASSMMAKKPETPVESNLARINNIAYWGADNLFPQKLTEVIRKNISYTRGLALKAEQIYGLGLEYGYESIVDGERIFMPHYDPQIDDFLYYSESVSGGDLFALQTKDLAYFGMIFPEFHLTTNRGKIFAIQHRPAAQCRLALQEIEGQYIGLIRDCFISANWGKGAGFQDTLTLRRPVISRGYDPAAEMRNRTDGYQYIMPVGLPSLLETYYTHPDHVSIIDSKWLDVSNFIPQFKAASLKNKVAINYIIEVADWYWPSAYPEWNTLITQNNAKSQERMKQIKTQELQKFNSFFGNLDDAGRSMLIDKKMMYSGGSGAPIEISAWTIKVLEKSKLGEDGYLEDARDAHTMIYTAIGIDESIQGKKAGTGGSNGSDKREAYNIGNLTSTPQASLILRVYDFVSRYNGWKGPNSQPIKWRVKRAEMQTKDQFSPNKRESTEPQ